MRICIVYDCLFPYTVGGAERWYRNLAERLAGEGHEVTYLTLRQWDRNEQVQLDERVRVVSAGPRMALYTAGGRRRILPPLVFGLGVLLHLLRNGRRYDVIHTCSFPYFSLLSAALLRPMMGFELVVDWFEVWSRSYWLDYLGGAGGRAGAFVQRICALVPQRAFCFSELHAKRLRDEGLRGPVTVLRGLYAGTAERVTPRRPDPLVLFAGRLIPEKQATLGVAAIALAAPRIEGLRGEFLGDGPERAALDASIVEHGLKDIVSARGFTETDEVDVEMRRALCMLLPSRREGYGMVVVEAAARGTPSIVVAGEDNAATELIVEGVNGTIAARPDPEAVADAIVRVHEAGITLRESTAGWFAENAEWLSLEHSLRAVLESYTDPSARVRRAVRSQVNSCARSRPRARRLSASAGSSNSRCSAEAIADSSCGSNSSAASPATSGSEETFEHATGTPRAIASSTGSPKPSYSEGNTNACASAHSPSSSSTETHAGKRTSPSMSSARARWRRSLSCAVG
jgi:glycosyltransferase involved in cell wall biosynthesis